MPPEPDPESVPVRGGNFRLRRQSDNDHARRRKRGESRRAPDNRAADAVARGPSPYDQIERRPPPVNGALIWRFYCADRR